MPHGCIQGWGIRRAGQAHTGQAGGWWTGSCDRFWYGPRPQMRLPAPVRSIERPACHQRYWGRTSDRQAHGGLLQPRRHRSTINTRARERAAVIRVLIVEDEEDFAEPLAFLLRKEGCWPVVTGTGPQALQEFDRNGADIVLLDLV